MAHETSDFVSADDKHDRSGLPKLPPHSEDKHDPEKQRSIELARTAATAINGGYTFPLAGMHTLLTNEANKATEPLKRPAFEVTRSFTDFWRSNTERLIAKYGERASEYDSRDLEMVGHSMATAHNQHGQTKTEKEISGVLFYLQGKISRALSAMFRTKRPTADTCEDAFIYSMMLAYRVYLAEKEAKEVAFCARDTDGDGNCQHCYKKGGCLAIGGPFP